MPCRAKISLLIAILGVLSAHAAPLNPERKNSVFQPGNKSGSVKTKVIRPADARVLTGSTDQKTVKVQKIAPVSQPASEVQVNSFLLKKAADATVETKTKKAAGAVVER